LGGADAGGFGYDGDDVGEGARVTVGEGERAEGGHLVGLIFEAAMHPLVHFGFLLAEEQERKNADDNDLEEDQSGHELAANRSWSEQRHIRENRISGQRFCVVQGGLILSCSQIYGGFQ
jgi:hypothetical protein